MVHIREHSLLYGERSLLKIFGPMLVKVCGSRKYKVCVGDLVGRHKD